METVKRQLSEEHLAKLAEGRRRAAERKAQAEPMEFSAGTVSPAGTISTAVDEAKTNVRPRRTSLRDAKNTLTVEGAPPGHRVRWANDDGNRVLKLQERGYMFVIDHEGKRIAVGDKRVDGTRQAGAVVSKVVGTDNTGKPLIAYLMAIREEWYEEDQAYKQEIVDQRSRSIAEQDRADGLVGSVGAS